MHFHFRTIEKHLNHLETANTTVSHVSIGWHIDHSLKVINSISNALTTSNPSDYKNTLSLIAKVLLLFKYIPRGKGKAPKQVLPPKKITLQEIETQLSDAKVNIKAISNLDKNAHFNHPYFGNMRRDTAVKFIKMHTNHHLKIVRDILR